jgi:hypothetical protein
MNLTGCGKSPPAPQAVAREARDMRERRDVDRLDPPRLACPASFAWLSFALFPCYPRHAGHRSSAVPKWFSRSC